jgi:release factor glutamine methyltransferase
VNDVAAARTVTAARRAATAFLAAHDIETPDLDARILLGEVLRLDLTGLVTSAERPISSAEADALSRLLERRVTGEPVARLLGRKEFWGLEFQLSDATLIPRPDTETVVETALDILRAEGRHDQPLRIADLGTGTGAILLALLSELPLASGIGTDISEAALATARQNASDLGYEDRATLVHCHYAGGLSGPFDLIVSNPPYIPADDIANLAVEVRDHDPHLALDGGPDGLVAYREIVPRAHETLLPGGWLILEVGINQSDEVIKMMAESGLIPAGPARADLAGIPRVVAARKTFS